jgi:hypothetical protein
MPKCHRFPPPCAVEEYKVDVSLWSWDMDRINAVLDPTITRRRHFTVKSSMINPAPPGL